jgi:hypothetical protein
MGCSGMLSTAQVATPKVAGILLGGLHSAFVWGGGAAVAEPLERVM